MPRSWKELALGNWTVRYGFVGNQAWVQNGHGLVHMDLRVTDHTCKTQLSSDPARTRDPAKQKRPILVGRPQKQTLGERRLSVRVVGKPRLAFRGRLGLEFTKQGRVGCVQSLQVDSLCEFRSDHEPGCPFSDPPLRVTESGLNSETATKH